MVELVMVIVVMGIIGVASTSLFSSRDSYAIAMTRDNLMSVLLLSQKTALASSAVSNPVTLTVSLDNSGSEPEWRFLVNKVGYTNAVIDQRISQANVTISFNGNTVDTSNPASLTWDSLGDLNSGSNQTITLVGARTVTICLSAGGYAYLSAAGCPS